MISMACIIIALVAASAAVVLYSLYLGTRETRYAEALAESRRRAILAQEREHTAKHLASLRQAQSRHGPHPTEKVTDPESYCDLWP